MWKIDMRVSSVLLVIVRMKYLRYYLYIVRKARLVCTEDNYINQIKVELIVVAVRGDLI